LSTTRVLTLFILGLTLVGAGTLAAAERDAVASGDEVSLRQRVRDLREGLRDVPLPVIVEALSGHHVLPWTGESRERLTAVANDVLAAVNATDLTAARVNEAGNAVETHVQAALAARGFQAGRPAGPSGRTHAAGYPDLEAVAIDGGAAFYIEVKTYNASTEDSTQRTFYLSPSADFKVTRDAFHLLIAVQLEKVSDDVYRAASVRWLDLSRLRCDLKHEFNASNRDMYRPDAGLIVIETRAPMAVP
jgi:hypothetical protein